MTELIKSAPNTDFTDPEEDEYNVKVPPMAVFVLQTKSKVVVQSTLLSRRDAAIVSSVREDAARRGPVCRDDLLNIIRERLNRGEYLR